MERTHDASKLRVINLPEFSENHVWGIIHQPMGTSHIKMTSQFYANLHNPDVLNCTFKTIVKNEIILVTRKILVGLLNLSRVGDFQLA